MRKGAGPVRTLRKAYLEITNVCNLSCEFCPGTRRPAAFLSPEDFQTLAGRLRPHTEYLYLHLMGEPLLHPRLDELLDRAARLGFRVMLTTNGTLLEQRREAVLSCPAVEKVSVSLHSFEGNQSEGLADYLTGCLSFAKAAGEAGKKCALRLWNLDGQNTHGSSRLNGDILAALEEAFPPPWTEGRRGTTLAPNIFLEWGERFDWPALSVSGGQAPTFCYGLRDQVGVLADGTVVPCCLDHEGDIPLGNLFQKTLEEILDTPRARAVYDGFSQGQAREPLCQTCGFARRF